MQRHARGGEKCKERNNRAKGAHAGLARVRPHRQTLHHRRQAGPPQPNQVLLPPRSLCPNENTKKQVTHRVRSEGALVDGAVQHRVHARPGLLEGHALAHSVAASGPAGVDQEAVRAVLGQLFLEQVGVP